MLEAENFPCITASSLSRSAPDSTLPLQCGEPRNRIMSAAPLSTRNTVAPADKNSGGQTIMRRKWNNSPTWIRVIVTTYQLVAFSLAFVAGLLLQVVFWATCFPLLLYNERIRSLLLGGCFHYTQALVGVYLNPFWWIRVIRHPPKGYKPSNTIIMMNHTSGADPWIASSATFPWEAKYIYKSDLKKIPVVGWTIQLAGDVPVEFTAEKGGWGTRKGSVARMVARIEHLQRMGIPQLVFPEGTRSKTGRLQPFKLGLFRFAVEHQCEILPLVAWNSQQVWPLGTLLLDCGVVQVAFGDPIRPMLNETPEQLKDRVRQQMIDIQSRFPGYNVETDGPLNEEPAQRGMGVRGAKKDT